MASSAGTQPKKGSGGNAKKGRASRPGQSAKRLRSAYRCMSRKAKRIAHSNGQTFLAAWRESDRTKNYVENGRSMRSGRRTGGGKKG